MATLFLRRQHCLQKFKPRLTNLCFISRQYHAGTLKNDMYCCKETFVKARECSYFLRRRCFSRKSENEEQSTPVSIVVTRGPIKWISHKIKLFLVNSYFDADFDEETFLEGAKQAVFTVSALISERKFNQLRGLLTDEAISNLKDKLSLVENSESYRITPDDILQTTIHDIGFHYDQQEKGRKWLHVMVSYICRESDVEEKELGNMTFVRIPLPRITRYSFRKECTLEVEDDWIITQVVNFKPQTRHVTGS